MQQGFNHVELSLEAFQHAFNQHRATIESSLNLIPRYYDQFVDFRTDTERNVESGRADVRRNHGEFRIFRNAARAEEKMAEQRITRLKRGMESRMDSLVGRMKTLEGRMAEVENTLGIMKRENDDNFAKLFQVLSGKI